MPTKSPNNNSDTAPQLTHVSDQRAAAL